MKLLSTILLLTLCLFVYSQSDFNYQRDFKNILNRTKDRNDSLCYDKLLMRFNVNDPSLKDADVLALLIGFTSKPEFKPYKDLTTEENIYDLNDKEKYDQAIKSATEFLKNHPLSIKALFEKSYAFHKLNQEDSASFYAYKGRSIFKAMRYSGSGRTPETPIFALGPADGQDYIRKSVGGKIGGANIGSMGSGSDKNGNFLDILEVVPRNGNESYTLYFIIQHATDTMFSDDELKKSLKEKK